MVVHVRIAIASVLLVAATCSRADIDGVVVVVADGDTVTVLDASLVQHKVRLAGIDAPEKAQAFGARSKQSLAECAFGRRARVEGEKIDRYGRLVGKLLVEDVDCNLRQVEAGLAWHYKQYQREQPPRDKIAYAEAEERAREGRAGLWRDAAPQPPWDYRRSRR